MPTAVLFSRFWRHFVEVCFPLEVYFQIINSVTGLPVSSLRGQLGKLNSESVLACYFQGVFVALGGNSICVKMHSISQDPIKRGRDTVI